MNIIKKSNIRNYQDPFSSLNPQMTVGEIIGEAMKTDPFMPEMRQHHRCYTTGTISAQGAALAEGKISAVREAVGQTGIGG
ncbi:MAG: hypothetical protein JW902_07100 [Syntrophaceae bacterium]|nr:hypothetical protein [Syntrophaceae bacterium]